MSSHVPDVSLPAFACVSWCPGEVLLELKFSQASDVWSWAVVVFEIWSGGQLPYRRLHNEQVWAYVIQGNRLSQPMGCNRKS